MISVSINKLRFDEMFLKLQEVVPLDSLEFVRDETARLAEECANQLSRRGSVKGSLNKDVRKVFSPLPQNAFRSPKQINGKGMKWLSAGDTWLYGVKPLRYHVEDSVEDMRNLFYKSKALMPTERRMEIGTHGKQTVYEIQRLVVKRGTYKKFISMLKSHIGRLEASFARPIFRGKLSGTVEVDETYIGGKQKYVGRGSLKGKVPVVSLLERGGRVRSHVMRHVTSKNLKAVIYKNVSPKAEVHTDESRKYCLVKPHFQHHAVKHAMGEYARREKNRLVTTNGVEGFFSLLKRGIVGTFHHVSEQHLPLYLAEFDHRP